MGTLQLRVTRSDGVLLSEQTIAVGDPDAAIRASAFAAADQATAAGAEGYGWRLEIFDPDGDLFPGGQWLSLVETSGLLPGEHEDHRHDGDDGQ